jgi:uncharacterized protein
LIQVLCRFALSAISMLVVVSLTATMSALAADATDQDRQRFAMIAAAEAGDVSAINRFIIVGTPADVRDEQRRTPLLAAVENNRLEAFKLLLAEGANINAQALNKDTPWLLAGALGRADMLRLMIPKGPDLAILNRFGGTALIPACERAHVEAIRVMLDTKIAVDHVNNLGWTCLLEIVILGDGGPRHQEAAKLILTAGANPSLADKKGVTPLAHAKSRGHTALVRILEAARGH